jgi:ketosteroid isomerase-like protein
MKKYLPFLILLILVASCAPSVEPLTNQEIEAEKQAVIEVMKSYNAAFQQKDFAGILPTLATDVVFFGTDSAEVIKNLNEFKRKLTEQFNDVDEMRYGEMSDISIQMDPYGNFASIIYGMPLTVVKDNIIEHLFLRVARTLRKEDGRWVIISGIIGVARGTTGAKADTLSQ